MDKKTQGKKNREAGARFERKVRKYFENRGWIVDKFTNNIDLEKGCFVPAKSNRFGSRSCGFPDFVIWKYAGRIDVPVFEVVFVECKVNGYLKPVEREKMGWLTEGGHKCIVASRGEGFKIKFTELGHDNSS